MSKHVATAPIGGAVAAVDAGWGATWRWGGEREEDGGGCEGKVLMLPSIVEHLRQHLGPNAQAPSRPA